jgi:hypothetical protein
MATRTTTPRAESFRKTLKIEAVYPLAPKPSPMSRATFRDSSTRSSQTAHRKSLLSVSMSRSRSDIGEKAVVGQFGEICPLPECPENPPELIATALEPELKIFRFRQA